MLNFFLILNIFEKKIIIRRHKEDFYLVILSIIFILLVYLNNYSGLNIIISVLSSLSNSGLTLINSDNNLSLYFILITIVGGSLISNTSGIKFTRLYLILKTDDKEIINIEAKKNLILTRQNYTTYFQETTKNTILISMTIL